MKIAFKILAAIFALNLISCNPFSPNSYVRDRFTNCYSGENTGIENKLNINGYHNITYIIENVSAEESYSKKLFDTFNVKVVLYPEGTFIYDYGRMNNWGIYSTEGNIVKGQFILWSSPGSQTWHSYERVFKIIDKNTIEELSSESKPLHRVTETDQKNAGKIRGIKNTITLASIYFKNDSLPNPNSSWLKNQSWVWCDDAKFDEWKASLKTGK